MTKRVALAAVAALLAIPAGAPARVIQAETVLPPGQSGHVPQSGSNPHLDDQIALFEFKLGGDPSTWRRPRRMYDVTVLGLAPKPALRFYDRGTWQQAVELGP